MKTIFIGLCGAHFVPALKKHGYNAVILPPSELLQTPVASHADMLAIKLGKSLLFCEYYYNKHRDILREYQTSTTQRTHAPDYPRDVVLNALLTKKGLYARLDSIANEIKAYAQAHNIPLVNVPQGYANCSVCAFDGGAITSDRSIATAMRENGENTLEISCGSITLEGYSYGFIGGASFYSEGKAFFFGNLSHHPDGEKIKSFCTENGAEAICLDTCPLTDVGGAIVL